MSDTNPKARPTIIIFANCYGWPIIKALSAYSPDLKDTCDFMFWENFRPLPGDFAKDVSRCSYVFFQVEFAQHIQDNWGRIKAALPPGARIVTFPPFGFTPLWANWIQDFGARSDPQFPDLAEPPFKWADRHMLALKKRGVPQDEIVENHLAADISETFGVHRLLEMWRVKSYQRDGDCDVGCSDLIDENFCSRQLFFWPWHCQDYLLVSLLDRALLFLGLQNLDPAAYTVKNSLRDRELPIHPSIQRALDVHYLAPDQTYLTPWKKEVSASDYYRAYANYLFNA